jgi:transcriptional regulator with XRE-family HTH domain
VADHKDSTGVALTGSFANRLKQLRTAKGLSQSELSRAIWGTTTDKRGYEVARNRDRISAYEKGTSKPTRTSLDAVAEELGVSADALAPDLVSKEVFTDPDPTVEIRMAEGGNMFVRVNTSCTQATAFKIVELLNSDPVASAGVDDA